MIWGYPSFLETPISFTEKPNSIFWIVHPKKKTTQGGQENFISKYPQKKQKMHPNPGSLPLQHQPPTSPTTSPLGWRIHLSLESKGDPANVPTPQKNKALWRAY